jgi:energy-coupling factor transporter ATP-binding protein EcfA2
VVEILGPEPESATADPEPRVAAGGEVAVAVRDLVLRFGDSGRNLRLADLELKQGQRLGLFGSNGCGKSTLLAALAGARRPDGGEVYLGDRRLYRSRGLDLEHGRAMLAPQFPEYLFTRPTVGQELAVDPVLAGRAPDQILAGWGLPGDLAERNPHSLSTGQRRRLALGLVLASERPVLLLDEPAAALDRRGRARVLEALAQLPRRTTLIMASHDEDFLRRAGCALLDLEAGLAFD